MKAKIEIIQKHTPNGIKTRVKMNLEKGLHIRELIESLIDCTVEISNIKN